MRRHPGSGAFREKADMSDQERLVELKDANKSYRISLNDLRTLWEVSIVVGKEPEFWLYMNEEFLLKCKLEKL
jgi:hypothetical protein